MAEVKVNRLSFADKYKISQWLGCNIERLHKERPSFVRAAKECGESLDLLITPQVISEIATSTELRWEPLPSPNKGSGNKATWNAIRALQADIAEAKKLIEQLLLDNQQLHAQTAILRGAVVDACKQARVRPPVFAAKNDAPKTNVAL